MLRVARGTTVKARTAATVQIRDLIITAPQPLRDQPAKHKTVPAQAKVCARFRLSGAELTNPADAAKFALR
jgi:transposase